MAIPFRFRTEPLALSKARFQAVGSRECNDQASLNIWHPAVSWDSRKVRVGRQDTLGGLGELQSLHPQHIKTQPGMGI